MDHELDSGNMYVTGMTIPITDLAISAVAINNEAVIYTLEEHFKMIPGVKLI